MPAPRATEKIVIRLLPLPLGDFGDIRELSTALAEADELSEKLLSA